MPAYLHGIATAVPDTVYEQRAALELMSAWVGGERRTDRRLRRIYQHSGIATRHSVVDDFAPGASGGLYADREGGGFRNPGTAERNAIYTREALKLFPRVAGRALERAGIGPEDVTHVITASCTGFVAPGPDLAVVRALGLAPSTERYHLGFMGCYAAFPALRMARAFCRADPDAVVLVAAVELCTLHLQPSCELDALVAASVFADGGAATVVSARRPALCRGWRVEGFTTGVAPEGAGDMAWTIGDTGFEMVLSSYVPKIVGARASEVVDPLLARAGLTAQQIRRWAVHPGGRAILDRVEAGLALPPEALQASRRVLSRYGNMSSATVLFVLEHMLEEDLGPDEPVVAMAFGPGLTVDAGVLRAA